MFDPRSLLSDRQIIKTSSEGVYRRLSVVMLGYHIRDGDENIILQLWRVVNLTHFLLTSMTYVHFSTSDRRH